MKNVVDVLAFELAGHDCSHVYHRGFRHLLRLVQIRLLGCGGVSHGLGGTNKLLVCHETMSSIGIIFLLMSSVVGGRSDVAMLFLARIRVRFAEFCLMRIRKDFA
jgi:hypothetical protein